MLIVKYKFRAPLPDTVLLVRLGVIDGTAVLEIVGVVVGVGAILLSCIDGSVEYMNIVSYLHRFIIL